MVRNLSILLSHQAAQLSAVWTLATTWNPSQTKGIDDRSYGHSESLRVGKIGAILRGGEDAQTKLGREKKKE